MWFNVYCSGCVCQPFNKRIMYVCMVCACVCDLLNQMTFDVDIWHAGSSWHYVGQGHGHVILFIFQLRYAMTCIARQQHRTRRHSVDVQLKYWQCVVMMRSQLPVRLKIMSKVSYKRKQTRKVTWITWENTPFSLTQIWTCRFKMWLKCGPRMRRSFRS